MEIFEKYIEVENQSCFNSNSYELTTLVACKYSFRMFIQIQVNFLIP